MSRSQSAFLVKQTLTSILFSGFFSTVAAFLVFRHMAIVRLSGSPNLIVDSIFQTFIATLMSALPPSILTARWMVTRADLNVPRTSTSRILIRALLAALAACLVSFVVLPSAMPRLLAGSLPFRSMLLLKCLYGMAIGLVVTPFAVAAVLRGPRRRPGIRSIEGL
jgi:hypothetical protein